jgi:hypothetical protein
MRIRMLAAGAAFSAIAALSACDRNNADNNMMTDMNAVGTDYGTVNDVNMMGTDMNAVDMNGADVNATDMNASDVNTTGDNTTNGY